MTAYKKSIASMLMFFMIVFSYVPINDEIGVAAANATTTNAILVFMDSWFGLFYAFLAVVFMGMAIYFVAKAL